MVKLKFINKWHILAIAGVLALGVVSLIAHGVESAHENPAIIATIPVGLNPEDIVIDLDKDQLYVGNEGGNTITVLARSSLGFITEIVTGDEHDDLVLDPTFDRLYVNNATSGTVSIVDTTTNLKITDVTVGANPQTLRLNAPLTVYLPRTRLATLFPSSTPRLPPTR